MSVGGEALTARAVAYAARDAVAYLEALWTGDKDRAGLIWAGADEREREAIAQALASIALTALRAPESTPAGRFVGVVAGMLEDGVTGVEEAGRGV